MVFRINPNVVTSNVEGRSRGVPYGGDGFNIGFGMVSSSGVPLNDPSVMTMSATKYEV